MTQSSDSQRHSFPAKGALPGEDDMAVAPDEAMADAQAAAGDAQRMDPGGYPHPPSADVPGVRTDPAAPRAQADRDLPQPEQPAGPGEHGAQTTPDDEQERRGSGSA